MTIAISPQKRLEIIDALRRGTVPQNGLETFAIGLDRFNDAINHELSMVGSGGSVFKAIRGEYGSGKTFFSRWLQERAKLSGFAASEIQISETDTPLHKLETVYRRAMERLSISGLSTGAFRNIIDSWFFTLEEDILSTDTADGRDVTQLEEKTNRLMEQRLSPILKTSPVFAAVLRAYRKATIANDFVLADGLVSWLSGQPQVAAGIKKKAGIKGEIDHFGALNFFQGLLLILKDSGHPGLIMVMDEVETMQRVRSDIRDKGFNSLRQLIDEIDAGRFPGLYLLITGTPAFFDSPQGVQRLAPLAQRLYTDFATNARFDNPRAVQIRLKGFAINTLVQLGIRIRDIYSETTENKDRLLLLADNDYIESLARAVAGNLGGKVGIVPRLFLKKLVSDVLDRIDQFMDFNPRKDYKLTLVESELSEVEKNASTVSHVDEIKLNI
jgi:hypothetical protein